MTSSATNSNSRATNSYSRATNSYSRATNSYKVLYIISRAPYSNAYGQEALEAALLGSSFDLDVSMLFIHDGVFQLKSDQNTPIGGLKQYTKTFRVLEDFGIEKTYVHDLSINARGLEISELISSVASIDGNGIQKLIAQQSRVFTF